MGWGVHGDLAFAIGERRYEGLEEDRTTLNATYGTLKRLRKAVLGERADDKVRLVSGLVRFCKGAYTNGRILLRFRTIGRSKRLDRLIRTLSTIMRLKCSLRNIGLIMTIFGIHASTMLR